MSSFARHTRFIALVLAMAVTLPVLAAASSTTTPKQKSLYLRLGGKKGVTAVVNDFVTRLSGDTRVSSFFAATMSDPARLTKFKAHLFEQICQASGGPCKYTGKDMKTAHEGMGIKTEHFNAVVEDLTAALDKFKVGENEKNQLLGILGPMKPDIAGGDE